MVSNIKYYHEIEQGSDEWHEARLGIVTASEVNNLVTPKGKKASGAKVQAYACEIASQRVNMRIEDSFQSYAMMKGHFHEDYAREAYSDNYYTVYECGFITCDIEGIKIGCSPDGLVGVDGAIEIKSREPKFQVSTIVSNEVPAEYINQIQTVLLVSGRKWVDFVQYSTGMPLFVKRVMPDEKRQEVIKEAIVDFEDLIKKNVEIYLGSAKRMVPTERVDFAIDDVITEAGE